MSRKPVFATVVSLAIATILTGCGDSNSSSSADSTTSSTSTTTSTTSQPPTTGSVTETSIAPSADRHYLTAVAAATVSGHDTLTFTFNDGTPGYSIAYVTSPLTSPADSEAVTVSGNAVLKVVLSSSATVNLTGGQKTYYSGPNKITPTETTNITEITKVSEGEGELVWGAGLKSKTPFTVTASGNTLTLTFS